MKVIARIEGPLKLGDLRRLFRETGGWSDDCPVAVSSDGTTGHRGISVTENDSQREATAAESAEVKK